MKLTQKITIVNYLVKDGFLATNQGYFIKIVKGEPYAVYYDWQKSIWYVDRAEVTGTFTTIEELEKVISLSPVQARILEESNRLAGIALDITNRKN